MRKFILFCLIFAGAAAPAALAQELAEQDDTQSWNDVQLTFPVDEKFDVFVQGTLRFGKNVSQLSDRRVAAGFVYKPDKAWSFSPFYLNVVARNSRGLFKQEHRLNFRVGYRFPTKSFGLSHRSTLEYRFRKPQNSWRYRPSLTFEKDIKKIIPASKIFVTEEVFYDSILKKFSRNRFTIGVSRILTKKLSLDVYYMRQNDGNSRPGDLNVVGTTWRIRL